MKKWIFLFVASTAFSQTPPVDVAQETAEKIAEICRIGLIRPIDVSIDGVPSRFAVFVNKKSSSDPDQSRIMDYCKIELKDKEWKDW